MADDVSGLQGVRFVNHVSWVIPRSVARVRSRAWSRVYLKIVVSVCMVFIAILASFVRFFVSLQVEE